MSKVIGIYVTFTKITHQIWSCNVILTSNFEKLYLSPNFVLILGKGTKFLGNQRKNKKVTGKNKLGDGGLEG